METKEAAVALAALSQPSRLEVFRLLVKSGENGLYAGEISRELDIPKPTLSFHLKELSHAGLIAARRDGRSIFYSLNIGGMSALMNFLARDCCQGRPELCNIQPLTTSDLPTNLL